MAEAVKLSNLPPGSKAKIHSLAASNPSMARLRELGVLPGTPVQLVRVAPLGDPIEISVRGSLLSLRKQEADFIQVIPV